MRNLPRWLENTARMVVVMMGLNDRPAVVPRRRQDCSDFAGLNADFGNPGDAAEYWAGAMEEEIVSVGARVLTRALVGPDLQDAIFKRREKPRWYRRLYLLAASGE